MEQNYNYSEDFTLSSKITSLFPPSLFGLAMMDTAETLHIQYDLPFLHEYQQFETVNEAMEFLATCPTYDPPFDFRNAADH